LGAPGGRECVMEFRIADTFTDSLARLTGTEQKAVKTTAFDLQLDPTSRSLHFHRLDRAIDPSFWSVRVNADVRLIVHKSATSVLLCFVGHHDAAYGWAERRRIARHPTTGAAQLVELPEQVEHHPATAIPQATTASPPVRLFAGISDDMLLAYGVPTEWLDPVRQATEDTLFDVAEHLPQEAAEGLLNLATGGTAAIPTPAPATADPFSHPDAQRRFRVLTNVEELERALDFPWEKWAVFLHPAQRQLVERSYAGSARVSGSAGTGKTIVALHRAVALTRHHPDARVLLTTFSKALANALKTRLQYLIGNEPEIADRIEVHPVTGIAYAMYSAAFGQPNIASSALVRDLLRQAAAQVDGQRFTERFLFGEWGDVVDAWQLKSWEAYRDVARLGRKTRIGGKQREALWSIFERVRAELARRKAVTWSDVFGRLTEHIAGGGKRVFDFAVVDEAQDVGIPELRFLAAIGSSRPDGLFLTGDLGQRIFQQPFSWKSLGVDIRGRSYTLRINYRTSHQIRSHADRLLPPELADVDGNSESRRGTISVFNGVEPTIQTFSGTDQETAAVGKWLADRIAEGVPPHEIGVFVRANGQLRRARGAVKAAGATAIELSDNIEMTEGRISIGTMHSAKGLEFRAVVVMACDDEVIPLQERIENVADEADLEEIYNTERHLLYVACTRARDHLLATGVDPASEFLEDIKG
jgi:UvrD-like helicase C-terminal domain/AAA domain